MVVKKVSVNLKRIESGSAEPFFYVGLVLRGTERQYVNLLKYINARNGSRVIYQSKSLTYLRIAREDSVKVQAVVVERDGLVAGGVS
jgi:hypothetical protein